MHTHSFKKPHLKHTTSVVEYVWYLKSKKIKFKLEWNIIKATNPYESECRECDLCTQEALEITFSKKALLNKTKELLINCNHKIRRTFKYYKPKFQTPELISGKSN